jgi:hypothetical protein
MHEMEMTIYSFLSEQTPVCALHSVVVHTFTCKGEEFIWGQMNINLL